MLRPLILSFMGVVFITSFTFATIINVPADYGTIQLAINASTDGDTVLVQPDTYYENINFNGHNIVLGSMYLTTGDTSYITQTIIDGNSVGSVVTINSGENNTTIITGFTLQNGSTDFGGGIRCMGNSSPMIESNIIVDNWAEWGGGGIYFESTLSLVERNVIYNNFTYGYGGGILCLYNSNPTLINNTFNDNFAFWGGGIACIEFSYPIIKNTIFWDDSAFAGGQEVIEDSTSWPSITYCDIQGGWGGEGNIDADPMFVDIYNGDFRLQAGSPCIDAGDRDSPLDPDGTRADMGAFYNEQQVGITESNKLSENFHLSRSYPNPFNAATTIKYDLPHQSQVTIDIYNILGRKVTSLIDQRQTAGFHYAIWNADGFSSGMYFYKLTAGDYTETKKMLLLK